MHVSQLLWIVHIAPEDGNATAKYNGITRFRFNPILRTVTGKSNNISYWARAITVRSINDFYEPKAITIRSDKFLFSVEALCNDSKI
jgi:hypothetical protein